MNGDSMATAAAVYVAHGWRIVPVHVPTVSGCSCGRRTCSSPGKHPKPTNWPELTFPPSEWANGARHNIGIVTGAVSDLLVTIGTSSRLRVR